MNIAIIGGGWYGCHLAMHLISKYGCDVRIYEQNSDIFEGSSSHNQNRLHYGFHYPRSKVTRTLCISGSRKFIELYSFCVKIIPQNLYMVAQKSILDFGTYIDIIKVSDQPYEVIDNAGVANLGLQNIQGCVNTHEGFIDHQIIKRYFKAKLAEKTILGTKVNEVVQDGRKVWVNGKSYDYCFNCTYNQLCLAEAPDVIYEKTVCYIYRRIDGQSDITGYTVVDGPFVSLYPYDIENNLYTLTHVLYTPLYKSHNFQEVVEYDATSAHLMSGRLAIETEFEKFLPSFRQKFEYVDYFISYKTKFENAYDSRETVINRCGRVVNIYGGKIVGIFDIEDHLQEIFKSSEDPELSL